MIVVKTPSRPVVALLLICLVLGGVVVTTQLSSATTPSAQTAATACPDTIACHALKRATP